MAPRATDLPEMKAILIENPDPNSPSGAKGIGEPTNELMAPAIANAIYNATGKRHYELPANLERVLLDHKLVRTGKRGSEQKELLDSDSCKIKSNR